MIDTDVLVERGDDGSSFIIKIVIPEEFLVDIDELSDIELSRRIHRLDMWESIDHPRCLGHITMDTTPEGWDADCIAAAKRYEERRLTQESVSH